jgi:hypothetical protein
MKLLQLAMLALLWLWRHLPGGWELAAADVVAWTLQIGANCRCGVRKEKRAYSKTVAALAS